MNFAIATRCVVVRRLRLNFLYYFANCAANLPLAFC
jgi:hypothetical protein